MGVDACDANITADKSAALNAERENNAVPVRGWTLGALARAFGEFAPRADSGLREAGWADADGGEPAPREPRENRPWTR